MSRVRPLLVRWRGRLSHIHTDHFRIARAAFWIGLFTLATKLVAACKEIAIAWRYGRGPEVDAYNLALTLATWLPATLVGVMTVILVPVLSRLRDTEGNQGQRFLAELNGLGLLSGMAVMLFVGFFALWGLPWFARGLDATTLGLARQMLLSFVPLAGLTLFVGVYTARMQVNHDHRYALAEGLPALTIIMLLLAWDSSGSLPLLAGTLLGTVLQLLWLARMARLQNAASGISWAPRSSDWPLLWRAALVMGLGQFSMSVAVPIDQYFAAKLGSGAIATLGYANKLISLGLALGAAIISRATLPIFSDAIAVGQLARVRRMAFRWATLMLLVGVVVATLLWLLAPWIVELVFQHGAFTKNDTQYVAGIFQYSLVQLPFCFSLVILASMLASARLYMLNMLTAVFFLLTKIAVVSIAVNIYGLYGVVLSTAIAYAMSLFFLIIALRFQKVNDLTGQQHGN